MCVCIIYILLSNTVEIVNNTALQFEIAYFHFINSQTFFKTFFKTLLMIYIKTYYYVLLINIILYLFILYITQSEGF